MPARTPEALHTVLQDAFNHGDLDAFAAAYEEDATLVVPPDGRLVHGRADIRANVALIFAGQNRMTSVVCRKVEADGLALTHARWDLVSTDAEGTSARMSGRGTLVSRRRPDGTWGILLDDPLTPQ
jgi:uncharacterized protein (TIGR02246 family)